MNWKLEISCNRIIQDRTMVCLLGEGEMILSAIILSKPAVWWKEDRIIWDRIIISRG